MLWNATSLYHKRNELIRAVADLQPGIILITETWLTPQVFFSLPGYAMVRTDRPVKNGGVAIFIHSSIHYVNIILNTPWPHDACFIKLSAPKIIIGVSYAPPGAIKDTWLYDAMVRLGSPFLIGVDWNAVWLF